MRTRRAQKDGRSDFPLPDFLLLLHQLHGVVMDGVGNLVAESSRELLRVLDEIEKRIHDIHVATRRCESIWLSFVDQIELEGTVVPLLRHSADALPNTPHLLLQRGSSD